MARAGPVTSLPGPATGILCRAGWQRLASMSSKSPPALKFTIPDSLTPASLTSMPSRPPLSHLQYCHYHRQPKRRGNYGCPRTRQIENRWRCCDGARLGAGERVTCAGVGSLDHATERNSTPRKGYPFRPQTTDFSGLSACSPCPDDGAAPGGFGSLFSVLVTKGKHVGHVSRVHVP